MKNHLFCINIHVFMTTYVYLIARINLKFQCSVGRPMAMGHFVGHIIESLICIHECVYRTSNATQWLRKASTVIFFLLGLTYGVYPMWLWIINMRQWAISFDFWWNFFWNIFTLDKTIYVIASVSYLYTTALT